MEQRVGKLQQRNNELESLLADNGLYSDDRKDDLRRLLEEKRISDEALADAEEAWMEALEAYEEARQEAG